MSTGLSMGLSTGLSGTWVSTTGTSCFSFSSYSEQDRAISSQTMEAPRVP